MIGMMGTEDTTQGLKMGRSLCRDTISGPTGSPLEPPST